MGHEVGAHSFDFVRLSDISRAQAKRQIAHARYRLQDILGCSIDSFSYPAGDSLECLRDLTDQVGYTTATTTVKGRVLPYDDMLFLPRQIVRPSDHWLNVLCKCVLG